MIIFVYLQIAFVYIFNWFDYFSAVNKVLRYILYSANFGLFLYLSYFRLRDRDIRRSPGTDLGCDIVSDPVGRC